MRRLILVVASAVALGVGGAGVGYALQYNPGQSSLDWKQGGETTGYGIPATPERMARVERELKELHAQSNPTVYPKTVYPNQNISGGPV